MTMSEPTNAELVRMAHSIVADGLDVILSEVALAEGPSHSIMLGFQLALRASINHPEWAQAWVLLLTPIEGATPADYLSDRLVELLPLDGREGELLSVSLRPGS